MKKRLLILVFGIQAFAVTNSFADGMPWPPCFPCTSVPHAASIHSGR